MAVYNIVDPLLNKYSATGINFARPLSAQAQQASKIHPSPTVSFYIKLTIQ